MMANKLEPLAVSMAEAARLLGVSRPTIYKYSEMSGFPAFSIGGRKLVSVEGLREWINRQTPGVSA